MRALAYRLWLDRGGATAIEYALLASLIAMVVFGVMSTVGANLTGVNGPLQAAANAMASAS
ncbi:MAG TPA: Flp family type IVb pilin [Stellaceae bacterium]|nr:Flp family type IVb pilin [Stellaceae bacterium]